MQRPNSTLLDLQIQGLIIAWAAVILTSCRCSLTSVLTPVPGEKGLTYPSNSAFLCWPKSHLPQDLAVSLLLSRRTWDFKCLPEAQLPACLVIYQVGKIWCQLFRFLYQSQSISGLHCFSCVTVKSFISWWFEGLCSLPVIATQLRFTEGWKAFEYKEGQTVDRMLPVTAPHLSFLFEH